MGMLHDDILAVLDAAGPGWGRPRAATAAALAMPELAGGLPGIAPAERTGAAPAAWPSRMRDHLPHGVIRLGGDVREIKAPASSFAGSRAAVLAQWSPDGRVAPYVLRYARALREDGWRVVLACGEALRPSPSLVRLCDAILYRTCPGYDFTSWKAALETYGSLYDAAELLLTNDSVFAPIGPLAPLHAAMDGVVCDFWGLVGSREFLTHLQSYYLVFRPAALRHPAFAAFWNAVDRSAVKADAMLREVTLTAWLAGHGLLPGVYLPPDAFPPCNLNPAHYFWKDLLARYHVPVLKRDLLRACRDHPHLRGWEDLAARKGYDVRLILRELA